MSGETVQDYVNRVGKEKAAEQYTAWADSLHQKIEQYAVQCQKMKAFLLKHDPDDTSGIDEEVLSAGLEMLQIQCMNKLAEVEDKLKQLESLPN
jgi:hypothetical protein